MLELTLPDVPDFLFSADEPHGLPTTPNTPAGRQNRSLLFVRRTANVVLFLHHTSGFKRIREAPSVRRQLLMFPLSGAALTFR